MPLIDKSEIDKIDDPEIKKIVMDASNSTDDEAEQLKIIEEKFMELEKKSFQTDPFKPLISKKGIIIIILMNLGWLLLTYFTAEKIFIGFPEDIGIISFIAALSFVLLFPIITIILLTYGYKKYRDRTKDNVIRR
jgi:hypothetical protein